MPFTQVQGQQVHYREWGTGDKTLLALHGWPADSSHYAELGPLLAKEGFRVIVPDLPGWGQTPPPPAAWHVSDYRRFVHDFAAALGLKDFFLFGHSFGGRVAIKYVLEHPYDVRGLILCAAAGIRPDPFTLKRRLFKAAASAGKAFFRLPLVSYAAPKAQKLLYRAAGSTDYMEASGVMKETIVLVLAEDLRALLPEIKRPTLLLWGSADGATPLADGKYMAANIPQSELHVFDGQRHNLPKLFPQGVAEQVARFATSNAVSFIE